jgi:hypothetical protein
MKKVGMILAVVFCVLSSLKMSAQVPADFFAGKWNVVVAGTPNGDAKMLVNIERKDGKLTGGITNPGETEPVKFTNVEEKETSVTMYFNASGYDVYLTLEKKGDNKVEGSMMDMFDAKGERVAGDVVK